MKKNRKLFKLYKGIKEIIAMKIKATPTTHGKLEIYIPKYWVWNSINAVNVLLKEWENYIIIWYQHIVKDKNNMFIKEHPILI